MILRTMGLSDVPRGLALCRACGWNQVAADWEQLLALGGDGCLVAEVDGAVAGTLTAVAYEQRFAWIGMVLVEPALRGRGIATALMHRAIEALGEVEARLDATPQGEPLYARLGFVEECRLWRMTREASPGPRIEVEAAGSPSIRPMNERDLEAVVARDLGAFGADRGALLRWALGRAPDLAWIAEGEAGPRGYCLGRPGHRWWQVGPIVADDTGTGQGLLAACLSASGGAALVVDAAAGPDGWTDRVAALGFVAQRPFIRMRRGTPRRRAGGGGAELAILGPEWG